MRSRWERAFAVGLGVLLLVLALAAQLLQSGSKPVPGSVASSEPDGRRALLLLLRDLGLRADSWRDPPGALPVGSTLLWLAQAPEPPSPRKVKDSHKDEAKDENGDEVEDEDLAPEPSPAELGFRAPSRYRRFVEEGGTLLLPQSESTRAFLVDVLGLASCGDVHASPESEAGVRTIRNERANEEAEELEVEVPRGGVLLPPEEGSVARVLWRGGIADAKGDDVLAIAVPVERGQVVLLGSDAFLDNARIGEHDHALFAARLAEDLAAGARILFDEYAVGLWEPRTPIGILASPLLFLATLHAGLLVLLLTWRSAWVREFPRDPAPLASASPLLRARTLAGLLTRANRHELLARFLRDGISKRLDRRSSTAAEKVRALSREFSGGPRRGAEELERLHESLAAIEREVD